jgi:hypothetical protein
VVVTAVAVLAGAGTALALRHHSRPAPVSGGPRELPITRIDPVPEGCLQLVNLTSRTVPSGYRVEFGDVAVPPVIQPKPYRQDEAGAPGWRYEQKTGFLFFSSGPPDMISVPAHWQNVVALGTPNGPASTLSLPSCPSSARWNTYVSAFFLRSPAACVPLRIRAGSRAATVWFGLGRRCHG